MGSISWRHRSYGSTELLLCEAIEETKGALRASPGTQMVDCLQQFLRYGLALSASFRCAELVQKRLNYMAKKNEYPKSEEELVQRFDAGEDLENLGFDLTTAEVEEAPVRRVNVDFPEHMLEKLDHQAAIRGINRQALIKVWLFERLEAVTKTGPSLK
jgi:predicted DNA binding CopG/RHH family protein